MHKNVSNPIGVSPHRIAGARLKSDKAAVRGDRGTKTGAITEDSNCVHADAFGRLGCPHCCRRRGQSRERGIDLGGRAAGAARGNDSIRQGVPSKAEQKAKDQQPIGEGIRRAVAVDVQRIGKAVMHEDVFGIIAI